MDGSGIGSLIGAGLGVFKAISDKTKQDQEKKQREQEIRLSPWTHMSYDQMTKPRDANTIGTIAGSAVGGAQQGQSAGNSAAYQNAMNSQGGASPSTGAQVAAPGAPAPGAPLAPSTGGATDFGASALPLAKTGTPPTAYKLGLDGKLYPAPGLPPQPAPWTAMS